MIATERIYAALTDEEDARACRDIPDEACREVSGSFVRTLASQFLTKLGDAISSPKIVLPWILNAVAAPAYLIGFLVPIRESGSLIPQIFIADHVRRLPIRKWIWVGGSVAQALAMLGMGAVAVFLDGAMAGWFIIGLLVVFSLARGACSVASKDVIGKTIPKGKRGQLNGLSASAAGLVSIGVGLSLLYLFADSESPILFASLLIMAALLWTMAAWTYSTLREFPGETDGGANGFRAAVARLGLLRTDPPFRRFIITRALLLCSVLIAPFLVALAQERQGSPAYLLGLFVVAAGLASLVSGPIWGRVADWSSRRVLIAGALMTSAIALLVFLLDRLRPDLAMQAWVLPTAYFLLSIAHDGIRVGRKTYILDLAGGNRRTDYVAVSNSVIGLALLVAGAFAGLSQVIGTAEVILALGALGLVGAHLGRGLPEA